MGMHPRTRTRWLLAALATGTLVACAASDPAGDGSGDAKGDAGPAASSGSDASAATTDDDIGAVTLHRLNAVEYDNTVRDLLGDTSHPASAFPPDDGAYGFTNIGEALSISPLLLEQYEASASRLAAKATSNPDIMLCDGGADGCAERILAAFLPRAWRRRVSRAEVETLTAVVSNAQTQGAGFADSVQVALRAALLSPYFLFRVETDLDASATAPHALDDYELANRLSYFLWSTMPDDALLAFAEAGKLSDPRVLDRQVRRMLADPKAAALIDNFASQWLLHTLDESTPDRAIFPSFDEELRASMAAETKAFVGSFVFGDQRLPDMLDAPFTFLDARLAAHYGIEGVSGSQLARVPLGAASHRGGLLTQASILTMTSVATRTSVVRRGEWVLSELLCAPPPPPPPDVPALPVVVSVGTMRQKLDEHRKNPACQSCHTQMDPIGFALEHYDALGRWRDTDQGLPIDATGKTPTGVAFDGALELSRVIKNDPRFVDCATRKLFTYALGRVAGTFDERRLKGLVKAFGQDDFRTKDLIVNIIASDAFRMRRGGN